MPFFISRDGLRIHYTVAGSSGEPVILLSGLASTSRIWDYQEAELSQRYRLFMLDYPGHGDSDRAPQYSIAGLVAIVVEFHEHLIERYPEVEQAHLGGLSMGCCVALGYAAYFPDRVLSLVLQGPFAGPFPLYNPLGFLSLLFMYAYQSLLWLAHRLLGIQKTIQLIVRHGVQTYGYFPLLFSIQQQLDTKAYQELAMELVYSPVTILARHVHAPTLIIRGCADTTPMCHTTAILKALAGEADLVIVDGARHIVALDQPEQFNRLMMTFLDTHSQGNRNTSTEALDGSELVRSISR